MTRLISLLLAAATAFVPLLLAGPASAGPAGWAPADRARIHPGVQMYTRGAQCTANFVFTDAAGRTYVGYAAHCAGTGAATDTDGCQARSRPLGTPVTFRTGGNPVSEGTVVGRGRLVYSSWLTMQRRGAHRLACAYNDFALVRVRARDAGRVNPSVPFFGGPTGNDRDGTQAGDRLFTYGNSSLRADLDPLSPHLAASLGDAPADRGWSHPLYSVGPGIPGDSGSGFLDADGRAAGTLSTLGLVPLPLSNQVGDLAKELAYAQRHSGIAGLRLVKGTEPFKALPLTGVE